MVAPTGYAQKAHQSGDISITTADVLGGIRTTAKNNVQATDIDTTAGAVHGNIMADSFVGDRITIRTADVDGDLTAEAYATPIIIDTSAGTVEGKITADSFFSRSGGSRPNLGSITITTADVTEGIEASAAYSVGNILIDTTGGHVSGQTGISAQISEAYAQGDIRVASAGITGKETALRVVSYIAGNVDIDTTAGALVGKTGNGLQIVKYFSSNYDYDTYAFPDSLVLRTGDVTGGTNGIDISESEGFFDEMVIDTTQGTIKGREGDGIFISHYQPDITLTTADVTGGRNGVSFSSKQSAGNLTIDTTAGTVTGQSGSGILLDEAGVVSIRVRNVLAAQAGIDAGYRNYSGFADSVSIEVLGRVRGGDRGIDLSELGGAETEIKTSGRIRGDRGIALFLTDGADTVTIFDELMGWGGGAQQGIVGIAEFGGGDDTLSWVDTGGSNILYDGRFSDLFSGGAGTDTAEFSVAFDELFSVHGKGEFIRLSFADGMGDRAFLSFSSFELFSFADDPDTLYTREELRQQVGAVPLPAGLLLLGSAVGGLSIAGRSSKKRARN